MAAAALIIAGCAGDATAPIGTDGSTGGGTAPTVVLTSPANGAGAAFTSKRITATFSKVMDPSSLNASTFLASTVDGPLVGTVSYLNNTATLHFDTNMPANTLVNARITTGAMDPGGRHLASNYNWSFTTGSAPDGSAPTVSSTDPANGATGVALNKKIVAAFSENMLGDSVNTDTFRVDGPAGQVDGNVGLFDNVANFKPTVNFLPNTTYTVTITTGVMDLSDNHMAENKVWTFTTGTNLDTTAPRIVLTDPAANETNVATSKSVSVTFSEEMDVDSLRSNTLTLTRANGDVVPSTITYSNLIAVLDPNAALAANEVYTVTATTFITDTSGNGLDKKYIWSFTTAAGGDASAPLITATNPGDGATNVFLNRSINASFNEPMTATSFNTSTYTVDGVAGIVSYETSNRIATFNPIADLLPNTTYTAHMETGVTDASGNHLAERYTWTFTTGTQRAQQNINLGAATSYAVLAGSTVTNAGPTVINGDLGVSPGSAVVGFPPGEVNGNTHAGDAQAAQAKADLLQGQLEAAGLLGGQTLPGDLSGLTFTPGLYKNSTSVMLSAGNVTLDAQGDADAVFIFQMGSTLTTSTGTQVVLANGAKAQNVYWSVGTSATLGVNSIFKGIVLAEVSITVNNGAVADGTFLTKVGAVTLESNTVTRSPRRLR